MRKDKINVYRCPKGHETVTVDVDEGTTPMQWRCRQRDDDGKHNCTEMAMSTFYNPIHQNREPEYEWYKPVGSLKGFSPSERDHIKKGGLVYRKIVKRRTNG